MVPVLFSENIENIRNHIELETGVRYDCCLINLYPDGDCACKFHVDPDLGDYYYYYYYYYYYNCCCCYCC